MLVLHTKQAFLGVSTQQFFPCWYNQMPCRVVPYLNLAVFERVLYGLVESTSLDEMFVTILTAYNKEMATP